MIHVRQFTMIPAEELPEQVHRSIGVSVSDYDINALKNTAAMRGADITGLDIATTGSGIVTVQHAPDFKANIQYGWKERRYTFLLIVESKEDVGGVDDTFISYVTGWTNFADATISGIVDPNIEFNINSITNIIESNNNGVPYRNRHSTFNVLFDPVSGEDTLFDDTGKKLMRPSDILLGITREDQSEYSSGGVSVQTDKYSGTGFISSTENGTGHDTIAKVITSSMQTKMMANGDIEDAIANAPSLATEVPAIAIPFLSELINLVHTLTPTRFTLGDIAAMDPTFSSNSYSVMDTKLDVREHDELVKPTIEATLASTIALEVGRYMAENLLATSSGFINGQECTTVATSMITEYESQQHSMAMAITMRNIAAYKLSQNGSLYLDIAWDADLFGLITVNVAVNGGIPTPFVLPLATSSLLSTNITTSAQQAVIISDVTEVVKSL